MDKFTFNETNLQYVVDYDYNRSGCTCNDWPCRCTKITEAWINNINVNKVIEELYRKHSRTDSHIDMYCFDRICSVFEIYNKDLYEVRTGRGYYGEEVYGVYFENEEKIFNTYCEVLESNSAIEKIKYCLELEYNYLIDCVEFATSASIIEASPHNINLPQMNYFIKLEKNVIEDYKNRTLPIAVCIKDGSKYRLIDGYHRFAANKEQDSVNIVVLE